MYVRTTAADLATWLDGQGGLWNVEGEPLLADALPAPAAASSLAERIRARGGLVMLLVPEAAALPDGAQLGVHELAQAAHVVDGHHVFQVAWVDVDGRPRDSWLLAEHDALVSSSPSGESTAARIVAGFRDERPSPRIRKR